MTSIILFILSVLIPIYLGRVVWKRMNQAAEHDAQPETPTILFKKVAVVGLIVFAGIFLGLTLIDLFVTKSNL